MTDLQTSMIAAVNTPGVPPQAAAPADQATPAAESLLPLAEAGSAPSLGSRIVKGAGWTLGGKVVGQILDLAKVVLLARLLTPGDFGLFGLVMLAVATLDTFSVTGFSTALVQKKGEIDTWLDTAWTVAAARGAILAVLLFLAAPAVAWFFDEPRAIMLLRVVCLSSLLQGLSSAGIIHFQKDMHFHKQVLYEVGSNAISLAVGLVLAVALRSVWALVLANVAGSLARCVISYAIHPYRPRIRFDRAQAAAMAGFGRWILFQAILIFLWTQVDKIMLGKLLGVTVLGVYQMAQRLASLPAAHIGAVLVGPTFPAYSKIQDDPQRLGRIYLSVFELVMSLVIPLTTFTVVAAPDIVQALLGPKWAGVVLPLQILAVAAFLRAVEETSIPLFMGIGRPSLEVWKNLARVGVFLVAVYPLTLWLGAAGTCCAVFLGGCATLPVWGRVRGVASLSWGRILSRLGPGAAFGAATALTVFAVHLWLKAGTIAAFAASAAATLVACGLACWLLAKYWNAGPYVQGRRAIAAIRPARREPAP